MNYLEKIGWDDYFQQFFEPFGKNDLEPGRVAVEAKDRYAVLTEMGELTAEVTGKLRFSASSPAELPKVGDWVALRIFSEEEKAIIDSVLPRKTKFSRKVAGIKTDEQVLAANIDVIFIVQGLDGNFSLRRLERTLVMVYESGAKPIIILNKTDLCEDLEEKIAAVEESILNVTVLAVSAKKNDGIDTLKKLIYEGKTYAFIGSSGVGKSTLINNLVGKDVQQTAEVREFDARGRHTTTRRELIVLPDGGCVIDTPGLRELQLWSVDEGLNETFNDIDELAVDCHFKDCTHTQEIKCAVLEALANGGLSQERYDSYVKLQSELDFLESRQKTPRFLERKRKEKEMQRALKKVVKMKKRR